MDTTINDEKSVSDIQASVPHEVNRSRDLRDDRIDQGASDLSDEEIDQATSGLRDDQTDQIDQGTSDLSDEEIDDQTDRIDQAAPGLRDDQIDQATPDLRDDEFHQIDQGTPDLRDDQIHQIDQATAGLEDDQIDQATPNLRDDEIDQVDQATPDLRVDQIDQATPGSRDDEIDNETDDEIDDEIDDSTDDSTDQIDKTTSGLRDDKIGDQTDQIDQIDRSLGLRDDQIDQIDQATSSLRRNNRVNLGLRRNNRANLGLRRDDQIFSQIDNQVDLGLRGANRVNPGLPQESNQLYRSPALLRNKQANPGISQDDNQAKPGLRRDVDTPSLRPDNQANSDLRRVDTSVDDVRANRSPALHRNHRVDSRANTLQCDSEYLRSLNDSQLVSFINSISQEHHESHLGSSPANASNGNILASLTSVQDSSTPLGLTKNRASFLNNSFRTQSSDPFDDSLDEVLANLPTKSTAHAPQTSFLSKAQNVAQSATNATTAVLSGAGLPIVEHKDTDSPIIEHNDPQTASPIIEHNDPQTGQQSIERNDPRTSQRIIENEDPQTSQRIIENEDPQTALPPPASSDFGLEQSSSDSEPDDSFANVGPMHTFNDHGTYFQNKARKQQQSDEAYVKWDSERRQALAGASIRKPIFEGCVIFVNGHTNPSLSEIHRQVILHGGKFLSYLHNKGAATHIVCDRLTPRKKVQFKNYRVVKAQWIVDCIKENELLNWREYRLIDDVVLGQKRLNFGARAEIDEDKQRIDSPPPNDMQRQEQSVVGTTSANHANINRDIPSNIELLAAGYDAENNEPEIDESNDEDVDEIEHENDVSLTQSDFLLEEEQAQSQSRVEFFERITEQRSDKSKEPNTILDAKHPDFLKHFFANSRLHHLSTWKSDLRTHFLRQIVEKTRSSTTNPSVPPNLNNSHKIIMHIDFDCFFATASCLNYPHLNINTHPIAVTHGGRTSDVASCNYVARKFGVSNGMWLSRAQKLCPELITVDYDFDSYEKYSGAFYNYLISSDKFDSIFPVSIDEVLVDATSYCFNQIHNTHIHDHELYEFEEYAENGRQLTDTVSTLMSEIRDKVFSLTRCPVSIGASHNVLLAKLAIRKAKPNGQFFLHGSLDEFLKSVPIKHLPGIGYRIKEKLINELANTDIRAEPLIQDLAAFSEQRLVRIFGSKTGTKLYNYARGKDDTSIDIDLNNSEEVLGRKTVSVDVNFGIRFDTVLQLENFLVSLSKELYSRLVHLGICGSALTLRLARRAKNAPIEPEKYLGMGMCDIINKSSKLGVPTNDWGIIVNELKALYRMINIPVKELRGVAVTLSKLQDVATLKKNRQMKLPYSNLAKNEVTFVAQRDLQALSPNPITRSPKTFAGPPMSDNCTSISDGITGETIDWEVFNALPDDIKRELKRELSRRGLQRSPSAKSASSAPGSKAYLQQLLPTQGGGTVKYARVLEMPQKSPSKKRNTTKSPSPIKRENRSYKSPTKYAPDLSTSYDESVLNELPSSIKVEVLKDLEYKRKVKKMNIIPMRDKIALKQEQRSKAHLEITQEWLDQQGKLIQPALFLAQNLSYHDMVKQLKGWVSMTFSQQGPHIDDINVFIAYLQELLHQNNLNRCLNLLRCLRDELDWHQRIINLPQRCTKEEREFNMACLNDWLRYLNTDFKGIVLQFCDERGIEVDFPA